MCNKILLALTNYFSYHLVAKEVEEPFKVENILHKQKLLTILIILRFSHTDSWSKCRLATLLPY